MLSFPSLVDGMRPEFPGIESIRISGQAQVKFDSEAINSKEGGVAESATLGNNG